MKQYDEIALFESMPGRTMKEYVVLPESVYLDKAAFPELLQASIKYVSSLPGERKEAQKVILLFVSERLYRIQP